MSPSRPAIEYYWEDLPVGTCMAFGAALVTPEAALAFAREFDPQPFHLDEAAAAASLFGRLSTSGWHTGALTMRMTVDHLLCRAASLGSPGVENLRWLKPVYHGDTLSVRFEVIESRPSKSRPRVGLLRSQWSTLNQHGDVVMTMQGWGMFERRVPAAAGA